MPQKEFTSKRSHTGTAENEGESGEELPKRAKDESTTSDSNANFVVENVITSDSKQEIAIMMGDGTNKEEVKTAQEKQSAVCTNSDADAVKSHSSTSDGINIENYKVVEKKTSVIVSPQKTADDDAVKPHHSTSNEMHIDNDKTKERKISVTVSPKKVVLKTIDEAESKKESDESSDNELGTTRPVANNLTILFSNLYLNSVQRLCLQFPKRCAEDLVYCQNAHFQQRFDELGAPSDVMLSLQKVIYQQEIYDSFIILTKNMCQRSEFPGERTFTVLIELLLSLNPKSDLVTYPHVYEKLSVLFTYLVTIFPPCWRATRPAYIGFFQSTLNNIKICPKTRQKSTQLFEIILNLTENTLRECSIADVAASASIGQNVPESMSSPYSLGSEDWEKRDSELNTFMELELSERLERLFIALRLILQVLEHDFAMWLLHNYRNRSSYMFHTDTKPLAVFVYGVTEDTLRTKVTKQLFLIFAVSVSKSLQQERLQLLERYIALLMVISNTVEVEHTVTHPRLGSDTLKLILEFFKKFKRLNRNSSLSCYLNAIDVLRIPYVRYTFIDKFLQMFGGLQAEQFSPEKVFQFISKKRWLKLKKKIELQVMTNAKVDEISCEKYLELLLSALEAYCKFHAYKEFKQVLMEGKSMSPRKLTTHSPLHTPIQFGNFDLELMERDIEILEFQLRKSVRVSKQKVDMPIMDISIDQNLMKKYRIDLRFLYLMQQKVAEQAAAHKEMDFSRWLAFLEDFKLSSVLLK